MIAQLQQLTTIIQKQLQAQPSLQPSSNVPTKFCSTHGPCFHSSNKCKHKAGQHDANDTQLNWTNKQQYLDIKAQKTWYKGDGAKDFNKNLFNNVNNKKIPSTSFPSNHRATTKQDLPLDSCATHHFVTKTMLQQNHLAATSLPTPIWKDSLI